MGTPGESAAHCILFFLGIYEVAVKKIETSEYIYNVKSYKN
jgi:hypothetical protein